MPTMRAMPCGWAPMVLWCRIMAADSSMAPSPPPGRYPGVVDAVGDDLTVLADSGVRSGVDVIRLLALGAKGVLLGRAYIYAPGRGGRSGRGASAALICRGYEGYHDPHRRDLAIGHQPRLP